LRHHVNLPYQQCGYRGYYWYETAVEFVLHCGSLHQNKVIHSL